jgi:hypothetical protein
LAYFKLQQYPEARQALEAELRRTPNGGSTV